MCSHALLLSCIPNGSVGIVDPSLDPKHRGLCTCNPIAGTVEIGVFLKLIGPSGEKSKSCMFNERLSQKIETINSSIIEGVMLAYGLHMQAHTYVQHTHIHTTYTHRTHTHTHYMHILTHILHTHTLHTHTLHTHIHSTYTYYIHTHAHKLHTHTHTTYTHTHYIHVHIYTHICFPLFCFEIGSHYA